MRLTGEVLGWGVPALLLGACAAEHVAPRSQGETRKARCSDLSGPRGTPAAVTSSGSPVLCERAAGLSARDAPGLNGIGHHSLAARTDCHAS
jgi:hypothetical protein